MTRNAWGLSFGSGIRPTEPTPSTRIAEGHHSDLYRFTGPAEDGGTPILLVPPLAAPATCFDLRPGQSLAAHLAAGGRPVYLVDYGEMRYADRGMGFEAWTDDILPRTIETVSAHHSGSPVDVVGWSLGGTLSLLSAAARPDLPIGSIVALGTPIDYTRIPTIAPLRIIGRFTGDRPLTSTTGLLGGLPSPIVQASYRFTALPRELMRPMFIARNLHDTESLAHMESIDRFMGSMPGYPAKFFQQMCAQLILGNSLADGYFDLDGRIVELADIRNRVLLIAGTEDVIAPTASVEAGQTALTGAKELRYDTVPGSHLGIVAGVRSRETTWAQIDGFLAEVSAVPA
ncbi:alpha/beta hydrolase [Rhodococcus triatomae]|nr:alpha/beta fold hydrolase [Rhodococcus triatomae]QNG17353.1 alpha/beta hydrolase [Rhodococcus triatomae]QNG22980.1 alpha/beta hydrolase [Rhodococcus triatomae]